MTMTHDDARFLEEIRDYSLTTPLSKCDERILRLLRIVGELREDGEAMDTLRNYFDKTEGKAPKLPVGRVISVIDMLQEQLAQNRINWEGVYKVQDELKSKLSDAEARIKEMEKNG